MEGTHPFEQAGLGAAPYRVIGVSERRGPIITERDGVRIEVGAPGQPMGCCDYCGQGIAEVWSVKSADGRVFEVGCDCVRKASKQYGAKNDPMLADIRRFQREKRHARDDARIGAARDLLADDAVRARLAAEPHPTKFRADAGDTLADWCDWMLACAGRSGKIRAARTIEAAREAQS